MIANDIEMAPMSSRTSVRSYQQAAATPGASDPLRRPEAIVAPESIDLDDARWTAYRLRRTTDELLDMPVDASNPDGGPSPCVAATPSLDPFDLQPYPSSRFVLLHVQRPLKTYSLVEADG
jgi:hypothetical protein